MTEYEVGRDTSQVLKMSDEVNTPQRSILDFFKTPQKDLISKPKDLLGFFCRNSIKKSPEITCNGKDHHGTKENVAKNAGVKSEGKNPKKRKRATSKEQDSEESEDGKNKKPAPRKNKLKRKKQETNSTKVSQKTRYGEEDIEILGNTGVSNEANSEKITETGNTNRKSIDEVGDNLTPSTQNGCVSDQERTKLEVNEGTSQGKTTPTGECGSPRVAMAEEGEESTGSKGAQGETMNLEWNKRIDIERCRTPNDKSKEKSSKKQNKLRKRKKEANSGETVNKSLNLSDICSNMADVSIISDGGLNTSQVLNGVADAENDKTQGGGSKEDTGVSEISYEAFLNKTADSEAPVWRDEENSGESEENYEDFLSKQKCNEPDALHGEKEVDKDINQGNHQELKEEESKTNSVDNREKPVKKTKGRPRKPSDSSHAVKKEAPEIGDKVGDKFSDDKLDKTERVKEVSYLDYLTAISKYEKEAGTEEDAHSQSSAHTGEPVLKPCEEDGTDIPMPKQYPSITNFFSRVGKGQKCPNAFKEKESVSYIKAIIHETPGENMEKREKSLSKVVEKKALVRNHHSARRTTLRKHQSEETIEVLSSEIIVVDEHIDVKSGENDKKGEKENVDEMFGNSNKSQKGKKAEEPSPDCNTIPTVTEEDAEQEKRKLFLHSVDVEDRSVTQKKSQATLSFSKGGLQMNKAVKESAERACESTPEPGKKKRGRPKKNNEETTQDRTSTSSPNSSRVFEDSIIEDKGSKSTPSLSERRKSLRQKYKVKLLQNQGAQSPIRMKFIRCAKSSSGSSQDESLTPKSKQKAKQQLKAQQLVEKAKRMQGARKNSKVKSTQKMADRSKRSGAGGKMTKGRGKADDDVIEVRSDSDTTEPGGRRRSSRLSDRQKSMKEMDVVELEDDEENTNDTCYTPTKPKKKAGGQKPTAAKKPEVKNIAPIFLKKKSNAVNSPVKRVLDPAAEKLKRDFLMSGVPAELKQSVSAATSTVVALYPPFPRDNHIQQRSTSRMWNMENVVLKTVAEVDFYVEIAVNWGLNFRARQPMANNKVIMVPSQSERFKENISSCLLTEIIQDCPTFPTQKMYSMLREKQDDEVIEETEVKPKEKEAKEKPAKDKPRRSLRRRKEVIEIIDVGGSPESKDGTEKKDDKQENVLPALSWPEKYQPLHSSEIIGNTAIVKKLRAWLLEWKQCLDKEAKRAKLMMMKEKKKARKDQVEEYEDEWWADDGSDFDLDSDSDGEGERLCNTAMLTGPLGVGKTATVYALAQELGFKVFEVNASSSRNGKRILAQLQEATQSQQVSQHHFSGSGTPKKLKSNSNVEPSSKPKPTFFTNLFKKAGAQQQSGSHKAEDKEKAGRKKRKREEDAEQRTEKEMKKRKKEEDGGKAGEKKKSLNLSCTSLILFDEVDLVFEAFDRGFWAAVKNFMDTTKIPIVLTSNDTSLPQKFDGRFEHYRFRVPPLIPTSCYLRLVALVENIRMDWDEIINLVAIYNSDIRRVLQILQLWVTSGGGQKVYRSIKESRPAAPQEVIAHLPVIDENSCSQDAVAASKRGTRATLKSVQDDDDDDFVSIKPVTSRKHQIISDDESSNPAPVAGERVGDRVLMEAQKCPAVNVGCLESMLGLPIQSEGGVLGFLRKTLEEGSEQDEDLVVQACQQYLKLKVDLLYGQHLDLLPLKKVTVENLGPVKEAPSPKTKRRRIKIASDLYDSEGSDSESTSVTRTPDGQTSAAQTIDGQMKVAVEETAKQKEENSPELLASLCEFAHFYDSVSFTDTMRSLEERILGVENSESGMTEDPKLYEHSSLWMQEHLNELASTVQWKSFNRCCRKLREIPQRLSDVEDERFTIPVLKGRNSTLTQGIACPDSRSRNSVTKAYCNVQSSLPLSTQRPRASIMCDYLPYLRSITKNEQIRQAAKLKRRFHHYFDQIGLSLKDQTLEILNLSLV